MPGPRQLLSPVVPVGLQALLSQLQQAGAWDSVTAALIPAGTLVNGDLDFVTSENKAESGYCSYGSPFFKKHFLRLYFLRAVSVSQQNREEDRFHIQPRLPSISIPHRSGTFVTVEEPTLTQRCHPESLCAVGLTLSAVPSAGWDSRVLTHTHHRSITQHVHCPQGPLRPICASLPSLLRSPWPRLTLHCPRGFALSGRVGVTDYAAFPDRLLSLSDEH